MSSPKFIISKQKVLEQYNKVSKFCDFVSYSSKTNPIITKILEENTPSMFSIHMTNELRHIKDNSRVLFFSQAWNQEDIKELISRGINQFTVDNEKDLDELIKFLDNLKENIGITLFLRIKLKENTLKTERYFVFGMSSEKVNQKIIELRKNSKIKNLGIHFHRKTQNMSEWNLKEEFQDMIDKDVIPLIDIVNIGGGLPSEYANTNIDAIKGIFTRISEFKNLLNENKIKMIIEPGRLIAAPSGKLITHIKSIYENNIIVNASIYNSDMDALIVPVKLLVEGELEKNNPEAQAYVIKGITPCSMDLFRYRVYLNNPKKGDEIVFLNAGAYNFSTDFCELEKVKTDILESF